MIMIMMMKILTRMIVTMMVMKMRMMIMMISFFFCAIASMSLEPATCIRIGGILATQAATKRIAIVTTDD